MACGLCVACKDCLKDIANIPLLTSLLCSTDLDEKPLRLCNNTLFKGKFQLFLETLAVGNGGTGLSNFYTFLILPQAFIFGMKPFNKIVIN